MFDEMKIKSLLKKELNKDTYLGLSDKIKNDPRIIQHFIEKDLDNINFLSQDVLLKVITNNYQLSTHLNKGNLNELFSELNLSLIPLNQDMYNMLSYYNQELLFKHSPLDFVNFASEERIVEMISEVISTNTSKKNNDYYDESYLMSDTELRDLILGLKPDTILSLLPIKYTVTISGYFSINIHSAPDFIASSFFISCTVTGRASEIHLFTNSSAFCFSSSVSL